MDENKKGSILIADDEHANIIALTHILKADYTIFAVKNGVDAIQQVKSLRPDIILLDVIMPEMDGFDVMEILKSTPEVCDIPVIFITGLGDIESEKKGLALGAADYVVKPFIADIVKLRVENQIKLIRQMHIIMEKELEEKSRSAKLKFLMKMSHEMMTPLNAVIGMTQIASRADTKEKLNDCLVEIDKAAHELSGLLSNLLNSSVDAPKKTNLHDLT